MEWMIMPLRRYADFNGRSRRLEYWMFNLFLLIVICVGVMLMFATGGLATPGEDGAPSGFAWFWVAVMVLFFLGIFIPSIAVQVRRMHDQNMSGWWILLGFIPYLGGLIMFVFMLIPGTKGPNNYGPDPKDPDGTDLVEVFR